MGQIPSNPARIEATGQLKRLAGRLGWLTVLTVIAFGALLPAARLSADNHHAIAPLTVAAIVLITVTVAYLVTLGILAHRLGRRWIVTCFLSLLLFPFGIVVSYFVMRRAVGAAASAAESPPRMDGTTNPLH